jgi:mannosyltransferase
MLSRRQHQVRAGALAIFGFLAMLWNLGTPSLWQDEAATIGAANRPLGSLWRLVGNIDAVHGFYYALIHFWGDAFGFTPFSLRVPSAIAVAASAYLLYCLALKLSKNSAVAIWASVVFLALPRTHMSGSEARSNALTATMAIALTYVFIWTLENQKSWRRWLTFTLLAALSIYLFMFSVLIFAAFGAYLLVKQRRALVAFVISALAALALSAPVLVYGFREQGQVGWITQKPVYQYLWEAGVGVDYNRAWPMALLGVLLVMLAIFRRASILLVLWAILPSVLLIVVSMLIKPYFVDHYLTFTTPATAILIALGLNGLTWPSGHVRKSVTLRFAVGAALVALCIPSFVASREPSAKGTEWSQIAQAIEQNSTIGDSVLLPDATTKTSRALDLMIVAYAPEFAGRHDLTLQAKPEETRLLFGKRMPEAAAIEPFEGRVLLVTDPQGPAQGVSQEPSWLLRDFKLSKVVKFESAIISVYVRAK